MAITPVQAPIAPGPGVGGEAFSAGSATTFTKMTRYLIAASAGTLAVTTNDGSTLTIATIAGQIIPLSVSAAGGVGSVGGVGIW